MRYAGNKKFMILDKSIIDGKKGYGITLRFGLSSYGEYVYDTYYICIDYDLGLYYGTQCNGNSNITWKKIIQ